MAALNNANFVCKLKVRGLVEVTGLLVSKKAHPVGERLVTEPALVLRRCRLGLMAPVAAVTVDASLAEVSQTLALRGVLRQLGGLDKSCVARAAAVHLRT